jgi:hypothetical protein
MSAWEGSTWQESRERAAPRIPTPPHPADRHLAILLYPGDIVPVLVASPPPAALTHWDGAEFALDHHRPEDGAAVYRQTRPAPLAGEVRDADLDFSEIPPPPATEPAVVAPTFREQLAALGDELVRRAGGVARGQCLASSVRALGSPYVVTLEVRLAED